MARTWFITGAGRGLGAEISKAVIKAGDRAVATGRSRKAIADTLGPDNEQLLSVKLDVADAFQARRAVDAAVARFGAIDVLVNNAGYGHVGSIAGNAPRPTGENFQPVVARRGHRCAVVFTLLRKQVRARRIFRIAGQGDRTVRSVRHRHRAWAIPHRLPQTRIATLRTNPDFRLR
jgi:NAD(P)-dependent dehydrogenase (short-subunit alcohol dehydrogenase family)